MTKHRTLEEKESIIKELQASGLSIKKWCKASGIPPSTINGWIYNKKQRDRDTTDNIRFIEVPSVVVEPILTTDTMKSITIRCNSVVIEATSSTDLTLLSNILKVVWPDVDLDSSTMLLAYDDIKNLILAPGITQKIKRTEVWKKC